MRICEDSRDGPPRIFCDFNAGIARDLYALTCRGTIEDLERLGLELRAGMRVLLYDRDTLESGEPAWLVADAVIVEDAPFGFAAKVQADSFRWEPRSEEDT